VDRTDGISCESKRTDQLTSSEGNCSYPELHSSYGNHWGEANGPATAAAGYQTTKAERVPPEEAASRCSSSSSSAAIFHTVPPCRQRIFQSQSYIRYIEGLRLGRMCDWEQELSPTSSLLALPAKGAEPLSTRVPPWLERASLSGHGANKTADVDTLFALRDFMLQEALDVVKFA
jgi:hypothetical protein